MAADAEAQHEDGATVGIDAPGCRLHASLRCNPASLQLAEWNTLLAQSRHVRKIMAQGKQTAIKSAGIHIVMAAAVEQGNQPRFGSQNQLVIQRQNRRTAYGRTTPGTGWIHEVGGSGARRQCSGFNCIKQHERTPEQERARASPSAPEYVNHACV